MKTKTIMLFASIVFTFYGCASQGTNYSLMGCATGAVVGAGIGFLSGGGKGAAIGGAAGCATGAVTGYLVHERTGEYQSAQAALEKEIKINNQALAAAQKYNSQLAENLEQLKTQKLALNNQKTSEKHQSNNLAKLKNDADKISSEASKALKNIRLDIASAESKYRKHGQGVDRQKQQEWAQTIKLLKQKEQILVGHITEINSVASSA